MEVVVVTKSHSLLSTMDFCIHVNPPIYHCKPSIALAPWYLPWPASLLWRLAQPWPIFQKCDASRLRLRLSAIPLELLQLALWYLPWRPPGWPGQTRRCKSVLPSDWASTHPRSKTCIAPFVPKNCPTKKCWYVALKSVSGFWHKLQISPYLHRGHVNQMNEDRALWKHIQDICFKQRWHAQHEHEQKKSEPSFCHQNQHWNCSASTSHHAGIFAKASEAEKHCIQGMVGESGSFLHFNKYAPCLLSLSVGYGSLRSHCPSCDLWLKPSSILAMWQNCPSPPSTTILSSL